MFRNFSNLLEIRSFSAKDIRKAKKKVEIVKEPIVGSSKMFCYQQNFKTYTQTYCMPHTCRKWLGVDKSSTKIVGGHFPKTTVAPLTRVRVYVLHRKVASKLWQRKRIHTCECVQHIGMLHKLFSDFRGVFVLHLVACCICYACACHLPQTNETVIAKKKHLVCKLNGR